MSIATNLEKQYAVWKEAMHWYWCENGVFPNMKNDNDFQDVKEIYLNFYGLMLKKEEENV